MILILCHMHSIATWCFRLLLHVMVAMFFPSGQTETDSLSTSVLVLIAIPWGLVVLLLTCIALYLLVTKGNITHTHENNDLITAISPLLSGKL